MSASTRSSAVMLHIRDMKSADSASLCACASSRSCRSRISSARSTEHLISLLLQHLRQMVDRSVGIDLVDGNDAVAGELRHAPDFNASTDQMRAHAVPQLVRLPNVKRPL